MADAGDAQASPGRPSPPRMAFFLAGVFGVVLATAAFVIYRGRAEFGDEGSFCTIAQGVLGGRLPYRDLFNEKPPLQYFWTAAVMAFGGPTLNGARIASAIVMGLTVGAIVLGPLRRRASALTITVVLAATAFIALRLGAYRNTADGSLALFYALSAVLLTRRPDDRPNGILLGLLQGVALGFRQASALGSLVLLFSSRLKGARLAVLGGLVLGLLAWMVPLAATGVVPGMLQATLFFHVGNSGASGYLEGAIDHLASLAVWLLLLGAVALAPGQSRRERIWALVWLAAAAIAYYGRKEEFRLWPSAAAALALLAWDGEALALPSLGPRGRAAALVAVAGAIAAVSVVVERPGRNRPVEAVAATLARVTAPGERVWAGPFSPYLYCLSQRQPATRFYFILPWTNKPEVRAEMLRDIAAKRPVVVIDRSVRKFDIDQLFPEIGPVLKSGYRPIDGPSGDRSFTIYRPVSPPPSTR